MYINKHLKLIINTKTRYYVYHYELYTREQQNVMYTHSQNSDMSHTYWSYLQYFIQVYVNMIQDILSN